MQLKPQIDTEYQGILHFGHFTLRVNGSPVVLDGQLSLSGLDV